MSRVSVFILGGGFIGGQLALQLKAMNYDVQVSTRSGKNSLTFESAKIQTFCFSVGDEVNLIDAFNPNILILSYPLGSKTNSTIDPIDQVEWISKYFSEEKIHFWKNY